MVRFIEHIESTALKLVVERHRRHSGGFPGKMEEATKKDMNKHGFSRETTAEYVVMIGDPQ